MKLSPDPETSNDEAATSTPTDEEIRLHALNRSKDKLMRMVGHDLRNSIGGVLTLSDMLEKKLAAGNLEEARRLSGLIRRATLDADELLEGMLAWTRKSGCAPNFKLDSINLSELVNCELSRLRNVAQRKEQTIKLETDELGTIRADPTMLRSILRNLLTNALKFSEFGQQVTLRIHRHPGGWKFEVCDEGLGMDDELQGLLLKIDERKQRPGTSGETGSGFGLLLCEDFIQRHGGHLSWESSPGKGSTFTFTIPELLG